MSRAALYSANYVKESGESSLRTYISTNDENITVLDVSELSDYDRDELLREYGNYLAGQKTFKQYLEEQGRSTANLKWRSFKRAGLQNVQKV